MNSPWSHRAAGFGVVCLAVMAGCASPQTPPPGPAPLCTVQFPHPDGGVVVRSLRPEQWFSLLVQGYDSASHMVNSPSHDCTGGALQWRDTDHTCAEPTVDGHALADRALTDDDLIISRVNYSYRLVWAAVQHFDNGEAVGPVALAEVTRDGVNIRCMGTLRAMPRRARLHFESIGDQKLLVAEGDRCEHDNDPTTCHRSVRMLLRHGDRFDPMVVSRPNGDCISPARFELSRDQNVMLPNGWQRRLDAATSITYDANGVTLHESVTVQDADPRLPAVPSRNFRRAAQDRLLELTNSHFQTDGLSLMSRMLDERASVATPLDAGSNADR